MKALTLTAIKSPLELRDREELSPKPGELVIRLKAAALNRRDYWITQGMYPGIAPPVVLGSDGSGVVTSYSECTNPNSVGREVIIDPGLDWGRDPRAQADGFNILGLPSDGTFANEVCVPACNVHEKPEHLDWHQAAALPLAGVTAWRALFTQGELAGGGTVLISGIGGGVASFALQFATAVGANVWVTSSSDEKIARATERGALGGFNYTNSNWAKEASAAGVAPDVIIDSAGGSGYGSLLGLAAPGARIVNYGATAGPPEKLDLFKVFWKQLRILGSTMGSPSDFRAMLDFVNEHEITPLIDTVMPLADGNEAIEFMQSSPQFGKYVLAME